MSCDIIDDIEDILKYDKHLQKEVDADNNEVSRSGNKSYIVPKILKKPSSAVNGDSSQPDEDVRQQGNAPGLASIYVKTWGCTHNNSDSEYMAGQLATYGYNLVGNVFLKEK